MIDPQQLSADNIRRGLPTKLIGRNVLYFETIDSTNRLAKELAKDNALEGTVVVADHQTQGRGRLDRQWISPPHSNLLISVLLRPHLAPLQAARATMICSLAATDAIHEMTQIRARIKWPNDIVIGDRKAGGILTELGLKRDRLDFVVVGIGLNVNMKFDRGEVESAPDAAVDTSQAWTAGLKDSSTSLSLEVGHDISRLSLLRKLLVEIEKRYLLLQHGHVPNSEWAERLVTLHQSVSVATPDGTITGEAEGVDADGALLVRVPGGRLERILAGDVTLRIVS